MSVYIQGSNQEISFNKETTGIYNNGMVITYVHYNTGWIHKFMIKY
jgi:hypothetical protein